MPLSGSSQPPRANWLTLSSAHPSAIAPTSRNAGSRCCPSLGTPALSPAPPASAPALCPPPPASAPDEDVAELDEDAALEAILAAALGAADERRRAALEALT